MTEVELEVSKKEKRPPPTGIRLGEELEIELKGMAQEEGVSLGNLCRQLIERGARENPGRRRERLFKSLASVRTQFDGALEAGLLGGTEAEEQADEIRRFFGQLSDLVKSVEED